MRFPNASFTCICFIIEIHPIMVKNLLPEFRKSSFSLRKFVNINDTSNISCVSTAWSVTCNFPFRLDKEDKMFYNLFYCIKFVYAIYIKFIFYADTLLIEHPKNKMTFILFIRIICILFHFPITEISPIRA